MGQLCLREARSTVLKDQLNFSINLSLQKETTGMVRRDTQEDKERQVQGIVSNKIKECLNFDFVKHDDDQIMESDETRPLELLMSLNVIQDP